MSMFQPLKRDGLIGFEGGSDGQVLDLDTAVKDGVFGGGGGITDEKLDLKKMIKELDLLEIPSVFICPISLEPMQDHVTLCISQTYERSNIHKWFNLGHLTCPATMQEIWDDTVTPNRNLHHLIYTWFSQKYILMKKRYEDVQGRATEILEKLKKAKRQARVHALSELKQIYVVHLMARKIVIEEGGVFVISSLLGPFTSHIVGSEVVAILVSFDLDSNSKSGLMQPAKVSLIVDMLNDGSNETKINCARLIRGLVEEKGFRVEFGFESQFTCWVNEIG